MQIEINSNLLHLNVHCQKGGERRTSEEKQRYEAKANRQQQCHKMKVGISPPSVTEASPPVYARTGVRLDYELQLSLNCACN